MSSNLMLWKGELQMFDKDITIYGRHATRMKTLSATFDEDGNAFFARNLDVYLVAPVVGYFYDRKAERDRESSDTASILLSQISREVDNLQFVYRLIMMSDKKNEPNLEERVNKAFRYFGNQEATADEELFHKYLLGGIDKIYEQLIEPNKGTQDFLVNLYNFMDDFEVQSSMRD